MHHNLYWDLLSIKARVDGSLPRKPVKTSIGSFDPPGANTYKGNKIVKTEIDNISEGETSMK